MFWDCFAYCDNLENIYFEEDSHLFFIFSGSIYYNKRIKHLRIPKSISVIPTALSLGTNENLQTLTYCGSAFFNESTFSTYNSWDKRYCPKTIYVMENYPYDNFGGCYNIVRLKQCSIYPLVPCLTLRYNHLKCYNFYFYTFLLII